MVLIPGAADGKIHRICGVWCYN